MKGRPGLRLLLVGGFLAAAAVLVVVTELVVRGALVASLEGTVPPAHVARAIAATRLAILVGSAVAIAFLAVLALLLATLLRDRILEMRAEAARVARGSGPDLDDHGVAELSALARALNRLLGDERELRAIVTRQRDEIALLLSAAGEGIVHITRGGRLAHLNPAARRLLGFPDDVVGQPVGSFVRHAELRQLLVRAAQAGELGSHELSIDGSRILVILRPLPDPSGEGAAGGVVAVLVDLTELRRLEGVRRDFVANVSHELKTPLTSIRGYSETLLEDDVDPELRRRFLETISANAERLQHIVDDLLDLSRLESGGWRPEMDLVDPAAVAEDAWSGFRERAAGQRVAFSIENPDGRRVQADPSGLRQVLCNLFDNALRYTPPGGRISVRIGAPEAVGHDRRLGREGLARRSAAGDTARVAISVHDTGTGIPRDALPRIFERFYRVDPARSRAEGGTGLGLSIVKHLAESMGGEVSAESELGRGTTIRVELADAAAPLVASRHSA